MESIRRCAVRFHDGNVAILSADRISESDGMIVVYNGEIVVGIFNQNAIEAAYMTSQFKKI